MNSDQGECKNTEIRFSLFAWASNFSADAQCTFSVASRIRLAR
jgi:hypothetical protein